MKRLLTVTEYSGYYRSSLFNYLKFPRVPCDEQELVKARMKHWQLLPIELKHIYIVEFNALDLLEDRLKINDLVQYAKSDLFEFVCSRYSFHKANNPSWSLAKIFYEISRERGDKLIQFPKNGNYFAEQIGFYLPIPPSELLQTGSSLNLQFKEYKEKYSIRCSLKDVPDIKKIGMFSVSDKRQPLPPLKNGIFFTSVYQYYCFFYYIQLKMSTTKLDDLESIYLGSLNHLVDADKAYLNEAQKDWNLAAAQ
jgi:hypothetical protein